MVGTMSKIMWVAPLAVFCLALLVLSAPPPSPADRYEGYTLFQVFFEASDNLTAITEYAKGTVDGVTVWALDYIRGQAEVAVSPQKYMEVRLEFESGDLDNFNIVSVNLADLIRDNLGIAATP